MGFWGSGCTYLCPGCRAEIELDDSREPDDDFGELFQCDECGQAWTANELDEG